MTVQTLDGRSQKKMKVEVLKMPKTYLHISIPILLRQRNEGSTNFEKKHFLLNHSLSLFLNIQYKLDTAFKGQPHLNAFHIVGTPVLSRCHSDRCIVERNND